MAATAPARPSFPNGDVVMEGRGVWKYYGAVAAVRGIDVQLRAGEILAIIGDNGAGKSTLIGMLNGAVRPDEGEILHRGERMHFSTPMDARRRGIETVYQDLALAPSLDTVGNLFLGREVTRRLPLPRALRVMNWRAMRREAQERLAELEIVIPAGVRLPVGRLSGGQRQAVAIARAAAWADDVLFMDEPTAALGVRQSTLTLELARRLADRGVSVVLITHSLQMVMDFADRIVVLRHGLKVADLTRNEATPELLVSLIVGFTKGLESEDAPLDPAEAD